MRSAVLAARPRASAAALAAAAVVALAAAAWVVAVRRMDGMDMGGATELGPLGSFLATWAPMMAAMMLPGAVPAIARRARTGMAAAAGFTASYLLVWAAAGLVVHALYRPHGALAAAIVVAGAGLYELAPLARHSRRRCREGTDSGLAYGGWCVGSSAAPMAVLLALAPMSVAWMALVTAAVLAQKLLPPITRRRRP
jgi:predicted metal-binding membrane protein